MRAFSLVLALGFTGTSALVMIFGAPRDVDAQAAASPAASAAPSVAPSPAAIVHVSDFSYKPNPVTVHAGDTVEFINDDSTAHTVTATDKSFDSGNMDPHGTWSHTFATAGTFGYTCAYHAFMVAKVIVTAP